MSMRLVTRVLASALALGLLGDWLLETDAFALNVFVGIAALMVSATLLVRSEGQGMPPWVPALMLVPPLVAFGLVWRAAPALGAANLLALVAVLSLPVLGTGRVRLTVARLTDYAAGLAVTGTRTFAGPLHFASSQVPWHEALEGLRRRRATSVLVGLLLAAPLLVVFSGLFASADARFERALQSVFNIDFESLIAHGFRTAFVGWLSAGYLMAAINGAGARSEAWRRVEWPRLGVLELGIPLGALTLLFTTFVVMQAGYVFGGEQLVQNSEGLGYAEYARRGFSELVAVAVLVLPVLLGANWLTDRTNPISCKVVRGLSGALLIPLAMIMGSALHRMGLYVDAYGLTQDRIYATAMLLWAGATLGWLGVTVLRSRAERFAFGAMVSAFAVLGALNFVNPDAMVVRVNLARAESGQELDVAYLATLSADAAPALASFLTSDAAPSLLSDTDACFLREELHRLLEDEGPRDWRSWNVGRERAVRAVASLELAGAADSCE